MSGHYDKDNGHFFPKWYELDTCRHNQVGYENWADFRNRDINAMLHFNMLGPYEMHYFDDTFIVEDEYKRLRDDDLYLEHVDILIPSIKGHIKCPYDIDNLVLPLYSIANNKVDTGFMLGKDIYKELHELDPYHISGYDTLKLFWRYLWATEHVSLNAMNSNFHNKTNLQKIAYQQKFNDLLYELDIKKRSDLQQILINIMEKNYKITREDYNNIINPFINRRKNQPYYQRFVASLKNAAIRKRKFEEEKQIELNQNNNIHQELYTLRSGNIILRKPHYHFETWDHII